MITMKDIILENIDMIDVLTEYNIKVSRSMFCCPFHNDRTPSAKVYDKSYFCFACGKGGDLIQFVQDYFNLSFRDALRKINHDFNLNLKEISTTELMQIKEHFELDKIKKEQEQQAYRNKMLNLCNTSRILKKARDEIKTHLNPYNWEEIEETCAMLTEQIELLDLEFERLNVKRY